MALPEAHRGLDGTGVSQAATVAPAGAIGVALNQGEALQVLQHGGNDLRRGPEARGEGLGLEGAALPNLIEKSL